ncbi:MAG: hypothetical protein E7541_03125 [Ruminococcaceae bacterium]|nr:hypothetical protein [Oscillospiraceae bacterium]
MSDKKNSKPKISGLIEDDISSSEFFGAHRSREDIRKERQEEQRRRKEEEAKLRAARREANRKELREHRGDIIVLGVILAVIVAIGVGVFIYQSIQASKAQWKEQDDSMTYFSRMDDRPELDPNKVTAVVRQAYYTKGGYLAVEMLLGNGSEKLCHVNSISLEIYSSPSGALIASGSSDQIPTTFTIPAGDTNDFTFYISPEYVQIKDDPLSSLRYSIGVDSDIKD